MSINIKSPHPGLFLMNWLKANDNIDKFSDSLIKLSNKIIAISEMNENIDDLSAFFLEILTGATADFWLEKQREYDESLKKDGINH